MMEQPQNEQRFFIASLKHTSASHEHVTFWGKDHCGYTPVLGQYAGEYSLEEARDLNDGLSFIAVPVEFVRTIESPEPYFGPGSRFYDQRGPVVQNSRKNWNALIKLSILDGRDKAPKPRAFRGRRRAIFDSEGRVVDA